MQNHELLACLLQTPQLRRAYWIEVYLRRCQGSFLLNAGRGNQLVEEDLTMALDNGQIKGAAQMFLMKSHTEPCAE